MTISARNINKKFGDFVALDDVSVDIGGGNLTALLGPSGGGKTTLLRLLFMSLRPTRGLVTIFD